MTSDERGARSTATGDITQSKPRDLWEFRPRPAAPRNSSIRAGDRSAGEWSRSGRLIGLSWGNPSAVATVSSVPRGGNRTRRRLRTVLPSARPQGRRGAYLGSRILLNITAFRAVALTVARNLNDPMSSDQCRPD